MELTTISESNNIRSYDILNKACAVAKIGWWDLNMETNLLVWSGVTREIHEISYTTDIPLDDALSFYKGASKKKMKQCVDNALNAGIDYDIEVEITTAKGKDKWVRAIGFTEFKNGKCVGFYGTFQDVSEQKTKEDKLLQNVEAFRKSFENAAIGKAIVGTDGKWIAVNRSLCKLLGYEEPELLSITFQDITHTDDLEADLKLLHEVLKGIRESYQLEKRYIHKDNSVVYALLSVSLVRKNDGTPDFFVSQITDITERKLAEQRLEDTFNKLKGILESSTHVAIISTDATGIITSFNKGAENLLAYSSEELVGKETPAIFHDHQQVVERSKEISSEFGREISGFDVFVTKARINDCYANEWIFRTKDNALLPVHLVITTIRNSEGIITGYLGIAADITENKKTQDELKALLDVLSDQNTRLKNFAHIVSHNLRSHSSNLSMLIDLIGKETHPEVQMDMFGMLRQAADQLKDTIKHLNDVIVVNSQTNEQLQKINLSNAINNAIGNINGLLKSVSGTIEVNIANDICIYGIPAYVDSVFNNLLTNAIKYRSLHERSLNIYIAAETQHQKVVVDFKDNGSGIDLKKHGHKIFGMYKTFHKNKDARGIGLFITKNHIEAMGGKIEVHSHINSGTTFRIVLNSASNDRNQ